jgi:hypothetical protein
MVKIIKAGQFPLNEIALSKKPISVFLGKILAGLESYGISSFDFDLFTCLRIPAFASLSVKFLKCAKAHQRYPAATRLQTLF